RVAPCRAEPALTRPQPTPLKLSRRTADMTSVDSQPHRLVVCDDDETVRQIVSILAMQAGYEIAGEAANALEAEALVSHVKPHVLVLDLALTGISGLDVI